MAKVADVPSAGPSHRAPKTPHLTQQSPSRPQYHLTNTARAEMKIWAVDHCARYDARSVDRL